MTEDRKLSLLVDTVISQNPEKVVQAKARPSLIGWFVGQVMKASKGDADVRAALNMLHQRLGI